MNTELIAELEKTAETIAKWEGFEPVMVQALLCAATLSSIDNENKILSHDLGVSILKVLSHYVNSYVKMVDSLMTLSVRLAEREESVPTITVHMPGPSVN